MLVMPFAQVIAGIVAGGRRGPVRRELAFAYRVRAEFREPARQALRLDADLVPVIRRRIAEPEAHFRRRQPGPGGAVEGGKLLGLGRASETADTNGERQAQ